MQDRYVGDVGDFGKYALLRHLVGRSGRRVRLGVVWWRYPDEAHNGDGRHVGYLADPAFASLDADLHARLSGLVASGRRSIAELEGSGALPRDTVYHDELVTGSLGDGTASMRRSRYRSAWLERALAATSAADLVFLDPDNGIASSAILPGGPKAGKYVFLDEIASFWRRGQSMVIYHHLNRTASNAVQVASMSERIVSALGSTPFLCPLVFRRGSCRVFWIVGHASHRILLAEDVQSFLRAGWTAHCDVPAVVPQTAAPAVDPAVVDDPRARPNYRSRPPVRTERATLGSS